MRIVPPARPEGYPRDCSELHMAEPGAAEAYDAARLAFEPGRAVRELRERRGWSQSQLAQASAMYLG
jgi:ribosome-binding protein aMBF1 (putative translation factor)